MANVLGVVWLVIGLVVTQTSFLVWAALMLPGPVARARQRLELKPAASFFTGLLIFLGTLIVAINFLRHNNPGPVQLIGWMLAGPMLAGSVVGGAAFAQWVGSRIQAQTKNESPILALIGGALCTALAGLVPVVGWVVFLPVVGFMGIGAGTLGLFSKREVAAPQPAPVAPVHEFVLPVSGGPEPQV
jgi:hypothetical protein